MIEFNNLLELKERITPALTTKVKEINSYVTEDDIWNYLKIKWKKSTNLTLYDIINDIINLKKQDIEEYVRSDKNDKGKWKYWFRNTLR